MFSGYFLTAFFQWFEEKKWKAVVASLACAMALALLLKTNPLPEGKIRIDDLANIGSAYLNNDRRKDVSQSFHFYRRAHELSQSLKPPLQQPKKIRRLFHDYHFFQARDYFESDDREKGFNALEQALSYDYSVSSTHYFYAKELFQKKIPAGALREALEGLRLGSDSKETHILLGAIYSELPHSPYWLVFHWEQALEQSQGKEREHLSKSLIPIREQLGLSKPIQAFAHTREKKQLVGLLQENLSNMIINPFNSEIPSELDQHSPQEILNHMTTLYQRLLLFPDTLHADIHYQLGMIYWKKENRLSAAVHHLEKAWDLGIQSPDLAELTRLHTASLNFSS